MITCRAGDVFMATVPTYPTGRPRRSHVVVISSKYLNQMRGAANAVPLTMLPEAESITRNPTRGLQNVPLEKPYYWAPNGDRVWALCEEVQLISLTEFDHVNRDAAAYAGKNNFPIPALSKDDLARVRLGVLHVLADPKDIAKKTVLQRYREYIKSFRKTGADKTSKKKRRR